MVKASYSHDLVLFRFVSQFTYSVSFRFSVYIICFVSSYFVSFRCVSFRCVSFRCFAFLFRFSLYMDPPKHDMIEIRIAIINKIVE